MPDPGHVAPQDDAQADQSGGRAGGWTTRRWMAIALAIVLLGGAASLTAALLWRNSVQSSNGQSFKTSATDVSSTLQTLIRRDTDFVRAVRAVLTMQPNVTASEFHQWASLLEDRQHQLGNLGALVVKSVPASELSSFLARRNTDPAFRRLVGGHVEPVPVTGRSHYCLLSAGSAGISASAELTAALQGDWCDPTSFIGSYRQNGTTRARFTQSLTESGRISAYSATTSGVTTLILEGAVYHRGLPLQTAAQRERAVSGWVLNSFDIETLLSSALVGSPGLAVTLRHQDVGQAGRELIGVAGKASPHAFTYTSTLDVNGTWTVVVTGAVPGGPSATLQAIVVFIVGMIGMLLLLTIVLVLGRSRESALALVREKTGQLRHQALHDALTGLPNRVLALDRAEQMLARARRHRQAVAALYVDVDGFKDVNDSFGHAAGDELLRIVATRLQSVTREGDTAARLAGDEFVVFVDGSTLDAGPELVAERLLEVLRQPYGMSEPIGRELSVTASIGIASGLRESAAELLRDADVALYEAKTAGRNRYMLFQSSMQTAMQDRLTVQMDLADALDEGQLYLLYQPTFDLQSERVIGVEALIRWRHPTRGVLAPAEFIPIAETTGLIVPIGRWVLHEACGQAAAWHAQDRQLTMSVNVSARQLDSDELIDDVRSALQESGLDPRTLTLEVTESALMRDPKATAERLHLLKQLGVRIAIDDFGTGYSSLSYLRQFPADALKIDRSFINEIAASKRSTALLHTLVQLAKTLEIETLAEGIEDQVQLSALQRESCDHGQGFLLSKPLAVEEIEAFLDTADAPRVAHPTP